MGELKETETVESKTMKKRKNLKESNVFKLLIYGLFLISCAAGFISGYFVIAEYYIGAYEENGTATAAAFESVVSNVTETEVYSYENQLVCSYLDNVTGIYNMDDETELVNFVTQMDINGDNTVDGTDLASYIKAGDYIFYNEYSIDSEYVEDQFGYIDTSIEIYIDGEMIAGQAYANFSSDTEVDYDVYNGTYYADRVTLYKSYYKSYEEMLAGTEDIDIYYVSDYASYAYGVAEELDDGGYEYYYVLYEYGAVPIDYQINICMYVPDITSDFYSGNSEYSIYAEFIKLSDEFVAVLFISVLLCICFMAASMILSGSKEALRRFEKIPAEFIFAGMFALIISLVAIANQMNINVYNCLNIVRYIMKLLNGSLISEGMLIFVSLIGAACIVTIGLLLVNNLIARVKKNSLVNSFLLVRAFKVLWRFFKNVFSKISLSFKVIICYIAVTVVEIVVLVFLMDIGSDGLCIFAYIVLKVAVIIALAAIIYALQILFKAGDKLAEGDYSYKADTKYMIGDFKKHGENLNNINTGVQAAVDERMKSERMKTELITNVSHDIKTPVTSIVNYVDLLEKENIDHEPEKSYIEVLKRQSLRLKKLVEDLVEASKASTGNINMELTRVDANMLIEQAIAEYVDRLSEKNISIIRKLSADKAFVMADGKYLWRVFDNLLGNAYKYTMPSTRMYINSYITDAAGTSIENIEASMSEPANVVIEFKNISKDELNISSDEIMERFVRGDLSRNTEGSGLGLSIAKNLCQLQNAAFDIVIDGDLFKACITFSYSPEPADKEE